MKALANVWDFITGGSIAMPLAVAAALLFGLLSQPIPVGLRTAIFLLIVAGGFVAAASERPQ